MTYNPSMPEGDIAEPLLPTHLDSGSITSNSSAPFQPSVPEVQVASSWKRRLARTSYDPQSYTPRGPGAIYQPVSEVGEAAVLVDNMPWPMQVDYVGGSEYTERFLFMGAWSLFLLVGYALSRAITYVGLPYDGLTKLDPYTYFDDVAKLLQYGFILGWFVRITEYDRFMWLFNRRQWYFVATYLATIPIFSAISNVPGLQHSLADEDVWGWEMWAAVSCAVVVLLVAIIWHLQLAWVSKDQVQFLVYLGARGVVILFYVACGWWLRHHKTRYSHFHVHHLYLGWAAALWAEFNHPLSALALAVTTAIFVQGVGVYSFANIFTVPDCFTTYPVRNMTCTFWADASFTLDVCPGSPGVSPAHTCWQGLETGELDF